jgi:hypothetical protein
MVLVDADTVGRKRLRISTPAIIKRILLDLITNHIPSNQPAFVIVPVNECQPGNISPR